ncbi:unnamed protein product, partial [Meganyctiphanes norvegica]
MCLVMVYVFLFHLLFMECRADYAPDDYEQFEEKDTGCPEGYEEITGQCLFFNVKQKLNHNDAELSCHRKGGKLVASKNPDELLQYIKSKYANKFTFWLGASDAKKEGDWRWNTGEPLILFPWADKEPNNSGGKEHC